MGTARITVITPVCVRFEYSANDEFVDAPSLFARVRTGESRIIEDGDGTIEMDTGRMFIRYRPDGKMFTPENLQVIFGEREWRPGMRSERNLGGTLETLDRVRGPVPLPEGLLSRNGWYCYDDAKSHLLVDGWVKPRPASVRKNVDAFFFGYGSDYRAALQALGAVAGPAPMPRRYALGSWYSRYWPYTSGEYREIVGEYDKRGYPLDVIVMDMDWHKPGWTGWSWNRELLPDAEELLGWFHKNGLAVTLNLHPAMGVGPHEDHYPEFMRAIGRDPESGETVPFDAGDRRYAEALFSQIHKPLEKDEGVDFWWLDWQQEKFTRSVPDLPNLRWLNYQYFEHTARGGKRGCSFSRWAGVGGWGDHRHPVHFSGDAHTGWDSLAFQVPFTAVAGNVGCFFWSHDIGGHFGPRLEEATTRWVQFGALSPVLRLHSARSGALDRRPWTYKPEFDAAMRAAFRLRSELFPYLYSMARKCHTEMLPLCRPMYIDWPEEEAAYENPQQYMLGDSLLVAPITAPGVGPRKVATQAVWFPLPQSTSPTRERGDSSMSAWFNYHTGERYEAGSERLVAAEIDEIPMFVPGGVPIVTREATLRMATAPLEKLVVVCYPGEPGSSHEFELYEDDGISDAHERSEYSTTPVRVWWFDNEVKVEVGIRVGMFKGMVKDREVVLELRGVERATHVRVDGSARGDMEAVDERVRIEGGRLGNEEVVRFGLRFETPRADSALKEHGERRWSNVVGDASDWPAGGVWHTPQARAMTDAQRATFRGLFGDGLRCDGELLHLYGLTDEKLTLEDSLGAEVVGRHAISATSQLYMYARAALPHAGRGSSPKLGLVARRTVVVEGKAADVDRGQRFLLRERAEPLRTFRVLGPFPYDPTKPMAEQRDGADWRNAWDRATAAYVDKSGNSITWAECAAGEYWPQDMHRVCGGHNGEAMAYALTHVWSPEDQEVTLLLESGDRMELWIGDSKVFSSDTAGESESSVDEVKAVLKKGWNQILAKTNEGGGGWGVRVAIDGKFELRESFAGL